MQNVNESSSLQNADGGKDDTSWEEYSEAFTNGLDIVGYNYMEDKYPLDHEMFPERVILGSENYPNEIGIRWPMVESTPYVIGDFTWTAYDYIGEAGIGKSVFLDADDPLLKEGPYALMSHTSSYSCVLPMMRMWILTEEFFHREPTEALFGEAKRLIFIPMIRLFWKNRAESAAGDLRM